MTETSEEFEYFYVSFTYAHGAGCSVIPQVLLPNGEVSPDGMNVAAAHNYLFQVYREPVIIMNWRSITKKRNEEFQEFVARITGQSPQPVSKKRPTHLSLVKNEYSSEPPDLRT